MQIQGSSSVPGPYRRSGGRLGGLLVTRCATALLWALLTVSGLVPRAFAVNEEFPEYQLKAAFLFNFAKFITWPQPFFRETNEVFTIGVVGTTPFGTQLEEVIKGKQVNGRQIRIRYLQSGDLFSDCHILFISRSERNSFADILARIENQAVLTVADEMEGFAQAGGMINFVVKAKAVRFEINVEAAERARLSVSSKLSGVGIVIKGSQRKKD